MKKLKSTFLFLLPLIVILPVLAILIFNDLNKFTKNDFFNLLELRANTIFASTYANKISLDSLKTSSKRVFEKKDYLFELEDPKKIPKLADSLSLNKDFLEKVVKQKKANYTSSSNLYFGKTFNVDGNIVVVVTSLENYFEIHQLNYLKKSLVFYVILFIIILIIYYYYYTKNIYEPILKIIEEVKKISSKNLHLRLKQDNKIHEINQLSKTFNNMLDRIETSFETQNNFISNASHELRTPLTSIIGTSDVTLSKVRDKEEYIETLQIILEEAEKLDNKTKALLYLAQTGFSGQIQKFDKVRIDQVIMDVRETLLNINPKSKISIDFSLIPDDPWLMKVNGNEQLLNLAFSNLVGNACKYSNYQTVTISIGSSSKEVYVVIKDTGIGIPKDELKNIYEPFFRATNTKKFDGYGIGLPLVKNVINLHKGRIIVDSKEGFGTTVQVNFPVFVKEI